MKAPVAIVPHRIDHRRLVASLVRTTLDLVHVPLPQDDPARRRPDIRKAQAGLEWTPTVPLGEGLRRTIEWFASVTPAQSRRVSA